MDPGWIRRRNSGNFASAAWGNVGPLLAFDAATLTDTSSAGVVASAVGYSLGVPTLVASAATTYTLAATLRTDKPAAGANVTLTNSVDAWFAGGAIAIGAVTPGIISGTSGSLTFTANGTNQDIALTPSGTGRMTTSGGFTAGSIIKSTGQANAPATGAGPEMLTDGSTAYFLSYNRGTSAYMPGEFNASTVIINGVGGVVDVKSSNTQNARFVGTTPHLLLGGLTTDGTGMLQFPAGTTNAGGINFGTEIYFFRTGTNTAQISASAGLTLTGILTKPGGASIIVTNTALTDGAGVGLGTLATAPAAGNPTKWIGINDNGTVRYVPAW